MTNRVDDINGWFEIKDNPLSKVGVFPYLGSSIDFDGSLGLDLDKIYMVHRSADELRADECVDSFKLLPWIDDHEMLGTDDTGMTPAENKGVEGVIGEDVYFDETDETLKGNIKVFSEALKESIDLGKKELSCGYRCKYVLRCGTFKGENYELTQTNIRGNHLALVDEGRMGPDVAVLDKRERLCFTIDSKDFTMNEENTEQDGEEVLDKEMTLEDVVAALQALKSDMAELKGSKSEDESEPEAEDEYEEKAEDAEECEDEAESESEDEKEDDDEKGAGMDSKQAKALKSQVRKLSSAVDGFRKNGMKSILKDIRKKDTLATSLSAHIGVFDHSEMDLKDVAKYGMKKLGMACDSGAEIATLNGFLHQRDVSSVPAFGLDANVKSNAIDAYAAGER